MRGTLTDATWRGALVRIRRAGQAPTGRCGDPGLDHPGLGEVTVAPVTTRIRDIPSEVTLSQDDGLPRECAVNCDHLQTVPRGRLGATITVLPAATMARVATAIRFALDLG